MENILAAPEIIMTGLLGLLFIFVGRHFQKNTSDSNVMGYKLMLLLLILNGGKTITALKCSTRMKGKYLKSGSKFVLNKTPIKSGRNYPSYIFHGHLNKS